MDSLSTSIKTFVDEVFGKAAKELSKKFEIPEDEVIDLFNNLNLNLNIKKARKSRKKNTEQTEQNEEKIEEGDNNSQTNEEKSGDCCIHKFLRGARTNQQCGDKISKKSTTGKYCTKHLIYESKGQNHSSKSSKPSNNSEETIVSISKNKYGNYAHVPSGLVFKSAKEKVVYGRQDEEGDVLPLTEEDIKLCKKYKFKYTLDCENEEKEEDGEETEDLNENETNFSESE